MKNKRSALLYKQALGYFPGGVNSPVRAFGAVGGNPLFIEKAAGSKLYDADGNRLIDYVMSWGALILGHADPDVVRAVCQAAGRGTSYGAPTAQETQLGRVICRAIGSIAKLRLVTSGTEATMSAVRASRGFTKKQKILKFDGCYHGHYDAFLVSAGSGVATHGISGSAGISEVLSRNTLVCPYNDTDTFRKIIRSHHKEIACVIIEPVCANMGVVLPQESFLSQVRRLTHEYGIVLIFDEVISGFRFCFGGAQNLYGITPDLTCLGKIIGGGLPMGAYGGKKEIMDCVSPLGGVYQAGTLSGNPLAVAAGLATLKALKKKNYAAIGEKTRFLCAGLAERLKKKKIEFVINRVGSLFTVFFTSARVYDFQTAKRSDTKTYSRYFWSMLKKGIYLPPSQFEAQFLSFSHTDGDINKTLNAVH